jgi:biotin synthase
MSDKPDRETMIGWLAETDSARLETLYREAYQLKLSTVGSKVYFRGIIEFSNLCAKDCYYCGIRRSNRNVRRYVMDYDDALSAAMWAHARGYGSIVFQTGERTDSEFIETVDRFLRDVREKTKNGLGITLSLGEQEESVYRRWFELGAHRYLLRIETSSPALYAKLHPSDHSWEKRLSCIRALKNIGYQAGTGVMIGLPGQTLENLADDILFFESEGIDMIGMGPYVPHHDTPLAKVFPEGREALERNFQLGLTMIALTRLRIPDVNIASTTALQAIDPVGREKGLKAGANILMPVITPRKYRADYLLYDGKPCIEDEADDCRRCLEGRVRLSGETVGWGERGDSPHYRAPGR